MKVLFINNDGGGYAKHIELEKGTTIGELFDAEMSGNSSEYLIRVNREPVPMDHALKNKDRVSVTPTKVDGNL